MAKMQSAFGFTGTIDNLSAYKMRGHDGILVRKKGGASKEKIKTSPSFELTRKNNAEFGGRSSTSHFIMLMLRPLKALGDHNIAGSLNKLLKPVQLADTQNDWGQRSVLLSTRPQLLEGFNLNKNNPFDSIVRNPVTFNLDRDKLSAQVEIPALIPGINFFVPWTYSYFGFEATLGIVPDLFYHEAVNKYLPAGNYSGLSPKLVFSDWYPLRAGSPAIKLELQFEGRIPEGNFSPILSIGIRFGTAGATYIEQVKYAGAAKILAVS